MMNKKMRRRYNNNRRLNEGYIRDDDIYDPNNEYNDYDPYAEDLDYDDEAGLDEYDDEFGAICDRYRRMRDEMEYDESYYLSHNSKHLLKELREAKTDKAYRSTLKKIAEALEKQGFEDQAYKILDRLVETNSQPSSAPEDYVPQPAYEIVGFRGNAPKIKKYIPVAKSDATLGNKEQIRHYYDTNANLAVNKQDKQIVDKVLNDAIDEVEKDCHVSRITAFDTVKDLVGQDNTKTIDIMPTYADQCYSYGIWNDAEDDKESRQISQTDFDQEYKDSEGNNINGRALYRKVRAGAATDGAASSKVDPETSKACIDYLKTDASAANLSKKISFDDYTEMQTGAPGFNIDVDNDYSDVEDDETPRVFHNVGKRVADTGQRIAAFLGI